MSKYVVMITDGAKLDGIWLTDNSCELFDNYYDAEQYALTKNTTKNIYIAKVEKTVELNRKVIDCN